MVDRQAYQEPHDHEHLPENFTERRLLGYPVIQYRQHGPLLVQVDCAWVSFPDEDLAEYALSLIH